MQHSSNDMDRGQPFTIRVHQQPDGRYAATSPNAPQVPATVAPSLQLANAMHGDKLNKLHREGKL